MFDIGWSELVLVGLIALIVIGPKELPTVLRTAGQWMGKVKRMASEFQGQFQEALREAEVADLKEQADDLTGSLKSITEYDPLADVDNDGDTDKEKEDDSSAWDESFETPGRDEPATGTTAETGTESGRVPAAPVGAVESAPAEELTDAEPATPADTPEDASPAGTPPPRQAGGSA